MQKRRATESARDLCRGPGRLCRALAIDRSFDGIDLFAHPHLWLAEDAACSRCACAAVPASELRRAAERRLRFYAAGSPYVSGAARLSPA